MDDLLSSIRQIIAEDLGDRPPEDRDSGARAASAATTAGLGDDGEPETEPDAMASAPVPPSGRTFRDARFVEPSPPPSQGRTGAPVGERPADLSDVAAALQAARAAPRQTERAGFPDQPEVRQRIEDAARRGTRGQLKPRALLRTGESDRRAPASNIIRLESDVGTAASDDVADGGQKAGVPALPGAARDDQAEPRQGDGALTSARTRQNVGRSLDDLSKTILTTNPRTVEDLLREMLRPMLREWLEANLGDIVERQVRQEIDRVKAHGR